MVKPNHIWVPPNTYLRFINGGEKMDNKSQEKGFKQVPSSEWPSGQIQTTKLPKGRLPRGFMASPETPMAGPVVHRQHWAVCALGMILGLFTHFTREF